MISSHALAEVSNLFRNVVEAIDFSTFVQTIFLRVVATDSVDIACEGGVERPPKYFASTCN